MPSTRVWLVLGLVALLLGASLVAWQTIRRGDQPFVVTGTAPTSGVAVQEHGHGALGASRSRCAQSSPTDDARQPHRGAYAIRPPVTRSNLSQNGNCRSSAAELNHKINS